MKENIEGNVAETLQGLLDEIDADTYICTKRKRTGSSVIHKPVDLHIAIKAHQKQIVAVEVANVNVTQLVGEVSRLYFDTLPLKLVVLHPKKVKSNVPPQGKPQCEALFCCFYGQRDVTHTPARVVWDNKPDEIRQALRDLLLY
jgi:hypothetical protein